VMSRAVLRPIRRLSRAARQLEQGRPGIRAKATTSDELGPSVGSSTRCP
jgi:HAMP domain-containing protein